MRQDLYTALKEQQFELHYQPLVDAASNRLCSVEALVRWILQQACRDMVNFSVKTGRDLPVAVNISSLQFLRDGFLEDVEHTLMDTGLSPMLLELEVTESVLLDGAEPVIELM